MGQTEQKLGLKMKAAGGGEKVEEMIWHDIIILNIRRMLDERGIRQTKVAEKLSVSKYAFNNMLSGRRIIRAEYIPIIAQALGCTCNDIFRVPKDDEKAAQ